MQRLKDYLEEKKRGTISETCSEHVVPIVAWRREPLHPRMQMDHLAGHCMAHLIRIEPAIDIVISLDQFTKPAGIRPGPRSRDADAVWR
jgi:hypothetical protein